MTTGQDSRNLNLQQDEEKVLANYTNQDTQIAEDPSLESRDRARDLRYPLNAGFETAAQLLAYFGETNLSDCGVCSVCIKKKSRALHVKPDAITTVSTSLKKGALSSRALAQSTQLKEAELTKTLKLMLELDLIEITSQNTYKLR